MFIFSLHIGHYIALFIVFYCTIVRSSLSSLKAYLTDLIVELSKYLLDVDVYGTVVNRWYESCKLTANHDDILQRKIG